MFGFLRSKTFISTAVLLALGVAIGVAHERARGAGSSFIVQDAATTVLYPAQVAARRLVMSGNWLARVLRSRKSLLTERERLARELRQLRAENSRLRECVAENESLRKELGLSKNVPMPMIAAEVIARGESNWFDTARINQGSRAGVEVGAAVVNHLGLIGQVVEVSPFSSQIVTLSDPGSSVGAMVQRSRSCGVIQGQSEELLQLAYLPKDADVKESDIITSSGMGGVVPKGFVIGRVVKVDRNAVAGTTTVLVKPSVRADQLEHVFVMAVKVAKP